MKQATAAKAGKHMAPYNARWRNVLDDTLWVLFCGLVHGLTEPRYHPCLFHGAFSD